MSSTLTNTTDRDRSTPASGLKISDSIQASFDDSFSLTVGILHPGDAGAVALQITEGLRYASVAENFNGTITWNLQVPEGVTAFFDNPGIEFVESIPASPVRVSNTQITLQWLNELQQTQGLSFHYRINVVIVINNLLVPVVHDPTVHNDPPTN